MLYIWPLLVFFSAPLFIPQLLDLAILTFRLFTNSTSSNSPSIKPKNTSDANRETNQSTVLQIFNRLGSNHAIHSVIVLTGTLIFAASIVRFNTIIHPFTLADNRHYMFYVFRYTILKAQWVKYALVPVYVVCGWLCWTALRGRSRSSFSLSLPQVHRYIKTPFESYRFEAAAPTLIDGKESSAAPDMSDAVVVPPPTSAALILLLAAFLSLVTAPLVEPRYFILPWVFWRLLVPSASPVLPKPEAVSSWRWRLAVLASLLETSWFLLINAVTMYIFVTRPFQWKGSHGEPLDDGRTQRFMW